MNFGLRDTLFFLIAIFTIAHAVIAVTNRNLVRSAFALLFSFLGVAGLYAYIGADFLAVIQIMVYVGGIAILFLFAIMLTSHVTRVEEAGKIVRLPLGILICLAVGVALGGMIYFAWDIEESSIAPTTQTIGNALLSDFLLPFELVALFLVIAMVGAVVIARSEHDEVKKES